MAEQNDWQRAISRGGDAAFRALLDAHGSYLYGIAHALTGNSADAEDLVQETLTGALRGSYRGEASLRTWLVQILIRQVGMLRRSPWRKRRTPLATGTETRGELSTPAGTARVDARLDVSMMLASLSPEHRAVIILRELQGMTYQEMAGALGVPRGTVESRLHRAREELRKRYGGYLS